MSLPSISAIRSALLIYAGRVPLRLTAYVAATLLILFLVSYFFLAPLGFPKGALIEVPEDASFGEVALLLEERDIVSSSFWLRVFARLSGSDREIHAGRYLFEHPQNVFSVLGRLARGDHGLPSVRVTFPEGTSVQEMGTHLAGILAGFDETVWNEQTTAYEGYLFPDTYDFYKDATIEEVVKRMRDNFDERTKDFQAEIGEKGLELDDVITMASLIEKEANTEEGRHIVSGILRSRIEVGVALQVDAVFPYIRGNPDHVPNGDDPELESPYNTYLNKGLPPGPITNPGLDAIDAALHPTETDYFYYLTGNDGEMYYAESFEEHKENREKYLD